MGKVLTSERGNKKKTNQDNGIKKKWTKGGKNNKHQ
jgi:hypothetical protein